MRGGVWLRRALWAGAGLSLASLAWLLWRYPPWEVGWWPACSFRRLTGLYCPGCGMTRALASLLHGDVRQSLSRNVLLVPLLALLPSLSLSRRLSRSPRLGYAVAATLTVFMVLRNLPWWPFTLLAP